MSKNYEVLHYIKKQVENFNRDEKLYDVLSRCFNLIESHKEPDGCMSNSVALYVCLKELGYNPQLCYGLCTTKRGGEIYHAWIELESVVIDLAIYGNINYNPLMIRENKVRLPIVLEKYNNCYITYGKFLFDKDWNRAAIQKVENWTVFQYINSAPQKGMHKLIGKIMDEPFLYNIEKIVSKYKNICISDFKEIG